MPRGHQCNDSLSPLFHVSLETATAASRTISANKSHIDKVGIGSVAAATYVKGAKPRGLTFVCVVAAPEGVARMEADHPEVSIVAGALDRQLNANAYILPGLGDFGDRLYGTE